MPRPASRIILAGMKTALATVLLSLAFLPASAWAACSGASLDREYREADLVVRARVVAETRHADDEMTPVARARWGGYSPVVLNRLRVLETFKGRPGPTLNLFQQVTSGRFDVEMGHDYLLFFNYTRPWPEMGSAARGTVHVRHACGQSRLWSEVTAGRLARLRTLAARR